MFDSPFPYTKINHREENTGGHTFIVHNYWFRGLKNDKYDVIVEHYEYDVYAVKFYLHKYKNCSNKYKMLSGKKECSRVLATVLDIMMKFLNGNMFASFIFVGSQCEGEEKNNTKRFKVYSKAVENLIGVLTFEHWPAPSYSAYLLLNRSNQHPNVVNNIEALFNDLYTL